MFSSLVRWFGRGTSGRGTGSPRRCIPQLEVLEGRAVPGGVVTGGLSTALLGAKVGSTPAGVGYNILAGFEVQISRSAGEEIPQ